MVTYKNIIEAVELLDEMTDAQLDKAFEEFGEKQPVLFDFLMSAAEEVGEEAEEYAAEYGFILYLIFKDKPAATEEQLAHAEEFVRTTVDNAEFDLSDVVEDTLPDFLNEFKEKEVIHFIIEELLEEDFEETSDDDQMMLMLSLMVVAEALS